METETDKLIDEQFKKLPTNLQLAIKSVPWKPFVQEVGKANALDPEQITLLEQETMLVIYGFEDPRGFIENISQEVGVDHDSATTLANDIAIKIFKPIEEGVSRKQPEQKLTQENAVNQTPRALEIPPEDLPATIPGEKVHDTTSQNKQTQTPPTPTPTSTPSAPVNLPTDNNVPKFEKRVDFPVHKEEMVVPVMTETKEEVKPETPKTPVSTHYPKGQDPYREPLE